MYQQQQQQQHQFSFGGLRSTVVPQNTFNGFGFSFPQKTLEVHPFGEKQRNEYVGNVHIKPQPFSHSTNQSAVETVIILDASGSMDYVAYRMATEIIPLFLTKLGYNQSDSIHLITFKSISKIVNVKIQDMKSLQVYGNGGTEMAPAVEICKRLFLKLDPDKPIRLLTISDGEIYDPELTAEQASCLVELLKTKNLIINSQAVRLFTSESQPDTKALCSLLQLNNITTSDLLDISPAESNEVIAERMKKLFENDNLNAGRNLNVHSDVILKKPWDSVPVSLVTLFPGDNLFWLKDVPPANTKLGIESVAIEMQPPLTQSTFKTLVEEKMKPYVVNHTKILKVVGTEESAEKIEKMKNYFEETEAMLSNEEQNSVSHVEVLSSEAEPSNSNEISTILTQIAEDDAIAKLGSAQQAEYLRHPNFESKSTEKSSGLKETVTDLFNLTTDYESSVEEQDLEEFVDATISEVESPKVEEKVVDEPAEVEIPIIKQESDKAPNVHIVDSTVIKDNVFICNII